MKIIDGRSLYDERQIANAVVRDRIGNAYKIVLSYDNGVICALYLDYENNQVNYNGEILFDFDGEQQTIQAVNGVAEIQFEVVDAGAYVVKTVNADVDNGEVTIYA